jgi:hypothetical protein
MTAREIRDIDENGHMIRFAKVEAPEWRWATDTPTLCPVAAGTGDSVSSLEKLLADCNLKPEWLKRPKDEEWKVGR